MRRRRLGWECAKCPSDHSGLGSLKVGRASPQAERLSAKAGYSVLSEDVFDSSAVLILLIVCFQLEGRETFRGRRGGHSTR